jgi:hypothetical protein
MGFGVYQVTDHYEISTEDMDAIATLDTGNSVFFDHRDPEIVKWIGGSVVLRD